jgi:cytochrome c biogenesis protein CcmG, thiol:disulfide interchange protein DsbE
MSAVRTMSGPGLLLVVFILCLLAIPAYASVAAGDKAPDFQLGSVDGQSTLKLSNYTTEPTLLVFWLSTCPHCQKEVPLLQKVFADLDTKGMNCVGVSADSEQKNAKDFVVKYAVTFPNAFGGTSSGANVLDSYGVSGVPTILIIDKGGTVKSRYEGETDPQIIRDDLGKLGVK